MTRQLAPFLVALAAATAMVSACLYLLWADAFYLTGEERRLVLRHSPLPPPPLDDSNIVASASRDAQRLGQRLFFDERLSGNGMVSCATCHNAAKAFADGLPLGEGVSTADRNTPSLINVAYNRWFSWDGRHDTLWSQALSPIENPKEMGGHRLQVYELLATDLTLKELYENVFGKIPTVYSIDAPLLPGSDWKAIWDGMGEQERQAINEVFANCGKSIAAYEQLLIAENSKFDRYVEEIRTKPASLVRDIISTEAVAGLKLFIGKAKCASCHSGPQFSDGEFHNTRVKPSSGRLVPEAGRFDAIKVLQNSEFAAFGGFSDSPNGSKAVRTKQLRLSGHLAGTFKTPGLRNVAVTSPYMHEGQLSALTQVVDHYSTFEGALVPEHEDETILAPLGLTEKEKKELVAFLESLTDVQVEPSLLVDPRAPKAKTASKE